MTRTEILRKSDLRFLKEALELGLSNEKATAVADEAMLCDLLIYKAFISLDRWDFDISSDAVVKLVGIMRQGIGRLQADKEHQA
jgi:hypothetical protein